MRGKKPEYYPAGRKIKPSFVMMGAKGTARKKSGTMRRKPGLSVVVPCYNEGKNVPALFSRIRQVFGRVHWAEVIVVDNGSTDGSAKAIGRLAARQANVRVARVKKNLGYGFGVWTGLKAARGEFVGWTNADLQADIADALRAYDEIQKQESPEMCFANGSRSGRPLFDAFFTAGMSAFETLLMGTYLCDINAQPNVFHKSFLKKMRNPPLDFSFDLYAYCLAKKLGYSIVRIPVLFKARMHGVSHWNTGLAAKWKFIKRVFAYSVALKKREGP